MSQERTKQLKILALQFGGCGCKDRCQQEEYSDPNFQNKPNGRFSVCELEAGKYEIPIPEKGENDEYEDDP